MVPTLLIISALIFTVIELPPGNYFETYIAELQAQGEGADLKQIEELKKLYGFDKPPIIRYFYWVGGMLQGDFGYSFEYGVPVTDVVGDRLWLTVLVSFLTITVTWLIAFPIGIYSATHQYSWSDYGLTFLGLLGLATPHFMLLPCSLILGSRIANAISEMSTPITLRNARNIRKDPARYMSWLLSARMRRGPVVSSDSTIAVISAPEMIAGRIDPMSEMKKLSAIRSGYLINALKG